jgi:hypothetical protein
MSKGKKYIIPKREIYSESFTFNLGPETLETLKKIANDNDCDVSAVVREGCKLIISKWKKLNGMATDEGEDD